jgi:hypothetical protein
MSMALWRTSLLLLAGHTSTQRLQPVQSSGATCNVNIASGNSRHRAGADLKPGGAPASAGGGTIFARITECGQTSTHLPHWMHSPSSQTGISRAMLRFSQRVVPLGKVPSGGRALTGRESPAPAIIRAVSRWTSSGASLGTGGRRSNELVTRSGTATSWR